MQIVVSRFDKCQCEEARFVTEAHGPGGGRGGRGGGGSGLVG